MAILSDGQALQLIKEPAHRKEIQKAQSKRIRHRLHAEPETDVTTPTEPLIRWLAWVKCIIRSDDNYERFLQLARPPFITNELTESIFSQFEKVFEANNSFQHFEFTSPELEQDFIDYRKKIGDYTFWRTQGFETFKNSIDNILIVDLPRLDRDQDKNLIMPSDRPEPYYYILDIDNLIDIDNTKVKGIESATGKEFEYFRTEYVIFCGPYSKEKEIVYVFDDVSYRIYEKEVNGSDYRLIDTVPHGLTFCPARSFWTTPLNERSKIQKRGPITNSLSELDWFLFFSVAQKYLELYAPFPIYAIYKSKCDYKETEGLKRKCVDGYLQIDGQRSMPGHGDKCPKCKNKIKVGPGNILELRAPHDKDDIDLLANPLKVIPAETESLSYVKERIKELKETIFANCVGHGSDPVNDQAQNELQIQAGFESRTAALLKVKRNFESITEFALDTIARLRYGSDYVGGTVNYGDQFFVKNENQEITEYEQAVKAGMPEYDLAMRRASVDQARYRNNPKMLERVNVLRNLLPFPDLSIDKVREMRKEMAELVPLKDLVIKMNFTGFIDRFEREQIGITQYGSALSFDRKIMLIRAELDKYADEMIKVTPIPGASSDVPGSDDVDTPIDVEAEAKAKLKGSVGGVQGILAIQAAVAAGTSDYDAAIAVLGEIFGFDETKAKAMLGPRVKPAVAPAAA